MPKKSVFETENPSISSQNCEAIYFFIFFHPAQENFNPKKTFASFKRIIFRFDRIHRSLYSIKFTNSSISGSAEIGTIMTGILGITELGAQSVLIHFTELFYTIPEGSAAAATVE